MFSICMLFFSLYFTSCTQEEELFDILQEQNDTNDVVDTGEASQENSNDQTEEENNSSNDNIDYGELKAFPNAFGAGAFASGGRGGKVVKVANLNASGPGSFREALLTSGSRTVVFEVSGNIDLEGQDIYLSGSSLGNLTIAGQTAPKGGITFTKGTIYFEAVDNVIIRYIRGRPAEATSGEVSQGDAFIFWGCNDVILDHISVSFGGDQAITFNSGTETMKRITIQRSLIADSYTGVIMGANNPIRYPDVQDVSFLNNLIVDMSQRTPNFSGDGYFESINNVIYNWLNRAINVNGGLAKVNHINNYHKRGRTTERNTIASNSNKVQIPNSSTAPKIYTNGNYYSSVLEDPSLDNKIIWTDFFSSGELPDEYFTSSPFPLLGAGIETKSAAEAYNSVLMDVGANKYLDDMGMSQTYIDPYDDSKINNVINDISTTPRTYSNWVIPNLPENSRTEGYDTDHDGIPNTWEISHGLDPINPNDGNQDRNGDGYTNLEDYLNEVDI